MTRPSKDIALVLPVFNEELLFDSCLQKWINTFTDLGLDFEIFVVDDGSWDKTPVVLSSYIPDSRIQIITKHNEGHGPTILRGYRDAVEVATWVFQADSDSEISPDEFSALWDLRLNNDAVIGWRVKREQSFIRKAVSRVAALSTRLFFSSTLKDPNIPFRLIRSDTLERIISRIPRNTFAPNLIISGALKRLKLSVVQYPVQYHERTVGETSLSNLKAVKKGSQAFVQTAKISRMFS